MLQVLAYAILPMERTSCPGTAVLECRTFVCSRNMSKRAPATS